MRHGRGGARRPSIAARVASIVALVIPLLTLLPAAASPPHANDHFARTWARTDRPVADLATSRTWMWGPAPLGDERREPYLDAPGGERAVQYYDKSRMELTDPAGDPASAWFVTNGLLVVELVSGRLQAGDDAFVQLPPAAVNVAGDPDDPTGPTYATIAGVLDAPPAVPDSRVVQRLGRDGGVTTDPALAGRGVDVAIVDDVTHHAIAAPFWSFMTSAGPVWGGGQIVHDRLFENPYYATGRPISEAYWTTVRVGGTPRDVLLQCFERRCLTYTPDNPDGWQVEAGNVGQHYERWRYESGHEHHVVYVDGTGSTTVTHGDSVSLSLPKLDGPAIVSIVPANVGGTLDGSVAASQAWRIEVAGGRVMGQVALTLAWDPAMIPDGSDPKNLLIAYLDEATGRWMAVPTTVDVAASKATATTDHLSIWRVFAPRASESVDPPVTTPTPTSTPISTPISTPPANVAPAVDLSGPDVAGNDATVAARAGAGPVLIAPAAAINDPDDTTIASVTVELLNAPDGSRESLAVTLVPSIVVNRDQNQHRIEIVGPATVATFETVLRSLSYEHQGGNTTTGTRQIVVQASDDVAGGQSAGASMTLAANNPPVATDSAVSTNEDTPVAIELDAADSDGDPLLWTVTTQPVNGTLNGTAPRLVYTPNTNVTGSDTFTWHVSDGVGGTATAIVTIVILPVNDPPLASPATVETAEDTPASIVLQGSDVDGDTLTVSVTAGPAHGTLSGVAPNLTYTPEADFAGEDSVDFSVSDGQVTVTATVSITVLPVDDPPGAGDLSVETDEDLPVPIALVGTDDGGTVTFVVVDGPRHGTLTGVAPDLTYTPAPDFNGSDSFTYSVDDGGQVSETATVSIVVRPVNDPPIASAQEITLLEDGSRYLTLTGSDIDGDVVRFTITRSPTLGNISIDGDWRCTAEGTTRVCSHVVHYGTLANVTGTDSFAFTVNDGQATSEPAVVTITIVPVNDPPIARDDAATANEDSSAIVIDVLANDSTSPDDNETLTIASVGSFDSGGSATIADGMLHYTPAPDFHGIETFRYSITDGNGGEASASVSVTVDSVNDAPTAIDDTFVVDEDSGVTLLDILANDHFAPDHDETLTISAVTPAGSGSVVIDAATGRLSYVPDADVFGTDTFTYTISDANGGSATASVMVTIRPVNDPPVATDDVVQIDEDSDATSIAVLANDSFAPDADETLVITSVGIPTLGTVEVVDGSLRYIPSPDANGEDTFAYTIADDGRLTATATVTVTVVPVNDPPALNVPDVPLAYIEDAQPLAVALELTLVDVDSDIASATISLAPRPDGASEYLTVAASHAAITMTVDDTTGSVTLNGIATAAEYQSLLRSLHYVNTSQAPTNGDRTVTIQVDDGEVVSTTTVTLAVVAVNDPPVLGFAGVVRPDAGPVTLDPDATLTDVDSPDFDGGQLSATITSGYDPGDVLSIRASGDLVVQGTALIWGAAPSVTIGQFALDDGLLVVTFTAEATAARVESVVRALAFATTSDSAADRRVAVVVSDGDGGGSQTGVVTVGVNQPPDDITLSATSIDEDADAGAVVGEVGGSDPNGDALSFALASGADPRFEVVFDGAWLLRVAAGAAFDHETEPQVALTLRATDPDGRSYEEAFAITIVDVNEPPALVEPLTFEIPENSPAGSVVGQLSASDPDAGQAHAFAISAGNDAGAFAVDAASGQISVADPAPLDYETSPSFSLTLTVTDDGTPSLSSSATVVVTLTDVVEQVLDTQPPVVENVTYGSLTGNLRLRGGASDGLLSSTSDPEGSALTLVGAEPYNGPAFGTLAWQPDGSFTWDPPAGVKNTAGTWQITVADAAGHQASGLVTFSLANRRVVHVDNAYGGTTRNGRWDTPYTTLAAAAAASATGDVVYLASGSAAYGGGITLKPDQILVGAGAAAPSLREVAALPSPTRGTQELPPVNQPAPSIVNSGGAGVTLSSANTVDGIDVGATSGAAIYGRGNTTSAGPVVRNVAISGAGPSVGPALDIVGYSGGTLAFRRIERGPAQTAGAQAAVQLLDLPGASVVVDGPLALTTSAMRGLQVRGVGSVELRGGVTISTGTYEAIYSQSSLVRLSGAAAKTVTTTGDHGVWVRSQSTFAVTEGNLRVTTSGGNGIDVYQSTIEMSGAGSAVQTTNGAGLWLGQATVGPAGLAIDAVSASGRANGIRVHTVAGGPIVIGPADPASAYGAGGFISGTTSAGVLLEQVANVTLRHLAIGAPDSVPGEPASVVRALDGAGVDAFLVDGLTLEHVRIARSGSHGVTGREVSGFSMTNSQVINAGDAPGEHGLAFDGLAGGGNGLLGLAFIAGNVVDGFWDSGLVVRSAPTAPASLNLTALQTVFSGNVVAGGAVRLHAEGQATMDVLVEACIYERLLGEPVDGQQVGTGVLRLTVR